MFGRLNYIEESEKYFMSGVGFHSKVKQYGTNQFDCAYNLAKAIDEISNACNKDIHVLCNEKLATFVENVLYKLNGNFNYDEVTISDLIVRYKSIHKELSEELNNG